MRRWITEVGLETMSAWEETRQYQKIIFLAERLIPLDPLDEALHVSLLNAVIHEHGRRAAITRYRESAAQFALASGDIPASLRALRSQWEMLN